MSTLCLLIRNHVDRLRAVGSRNPSSTITVTYATAVTGADFAADSSQVASGYTPTFDSSATGYGTGTTVNTPSVTASGTDVFYSVSSAVVTAVNSPWVANGISSVDRTLSGSRESVNHYIW